MFASVGGREQLESLAAARREIDAREAAWLRDVAAYDRSQRWRADGYASAGAALAAACRMTEGAARGHVELARSLEELPELAEAFGDGSLSRQHASVIAKAHTHERAEAVASVAPMLVGAAVRLNPRQLGAIVQHTVEKIDHDDGARSDEAMRARRSMRLSRRLDHMVSGDALFDAESGEVVLTALAAEMRRDRRVGETRTPAQRRHDALVNLCRRALDDGAVGGFRKARPHVVVVVDIEKQGDEALFDDARIEAAHVGHLSRNTLRRISCDCSVARVVTAGRSEVLDVGRSTRTVPPAIWRALVARDRHCQAPGCDRPAGRCEAHHLVHWEDGGPTSLENLRLLCWHHHHEAHAHDPPRRRQVA